MAESVLSRDAPPTPVAKRVSFGKLAAWVTCATVLVILAGAVVRITGSGAGCGQHWPSCNGEIAHLPKTVETWIELGHRTTSGLDLLGVLALAFTAWQRFEPRHPARVAAFAALALILVEALIGAQLVLLNLVGSDSSLDRAVVMPAHLVTTSLLLGALAAATYFGSKGRLTPVASLSPAAARSLRAAYVWVLVAGALLLLVSMSGAVTALGDTVYPVQGATTLERWRNDQAVGSHFLGKVRALHPLLALLGVGALWVAAARARSACGARPVQQLTLGVLLGGGGALALGLANIGLGAPGYLQVAHLLMACLLWMSVVLLAAMLWDARVERSS